MPIEQEGVSIAGNDDYVMDIFQETEIMSTYLLAWLVSDFTYREGILTENKIPFRIWSQPGKY